jgi:hypothetical protein
VGGGNIIQSGATLFQEDLVKNGFADSDSLYKLIYSGKGRMPGFGADCAPKVLTTGCYCCIQAVHLGNLGPLTG